MIDSYDAAIRRPVVLTRDGHPTISGRVFFVSRQGRAKVITPSGATLTCHVSELKPDVMDAQQFHDAFDGPDQEPEEDPHAA